MKNNRIILTRQEFTRIMILSALIFIIIGAGGQYPAADSRTADSLSNKVIRIHILAASDSQEDQAMKLDVRDYLLSIWGSRLSAFDDRSEALEWLEGHISDITEDVNSYLLTRAAGYTAASEVVNMTFPARTYNDFVYPQGDYDALRIYLGGGEGQNWWCVLYPPLCFVNVYEDASAPDNGDIDVKWKTMDVIESTEYEADIEDVEDTEVTTAD